MRRLSSLAGFAAAAAALLLSAPSCERQRASTARNFYEEVAEKTNHPEKWLPDHGDSHGHAKPPPAKPAGENAIQPAAKKRENASGLPAPQNRAAPPKDPNAPDGPGPSPAADQPPAPPADKLVPGEKK